MGSNVQIAARMIPGGCCLPTPQLVHATGHGYVLALAIVAAVLLRARSPSHEERRWRDSYRLARRPTLATCSSAETTSAMGTVVTIS